MDPIQAHTDYSVTGGKLIIYRKKTLQLNQGRKNPISHLSRIKNPDLPYPSIAAALQAYGYVLSSLNIQTPQEPLLPSLAYLSQGSLRPNQALPTDCCVFIVVSHILTIPCVLSLVNHCLIHHASPPQGLLKA